MKGNPSLPSLPKKLCLPRRRICVLFFLLQLFSLGVFAQTNITGSVKDSKGIGIPRVSIILKGASAAATTDGSGKFSIHLPVAGGTLVFSSVGFKSQEVFATGKNVIDVVLEEDVTKLGEVVVVGYGTQKKANLTGAVDQIGSEHFEDRPVPNVSRALQGALPNLNLRITDGKPIRGASFNIRGITSIGSGGQALILIDGVPGDPMTLNPNDIESVTVLKDAASAAIYGARGSFGVVLITTKNPGKSKFQINYAGSYSINTRTAKPDWVTDGYTWAKMFNESYLSWTDYVQAPKTVSSFFPFSPAYLDELKQRHDNPGTLPDITIDPATGKYVYYGNTDWQKELYKDYNPSMEHSLSASGGSDKIGYTMSGRYYQQDGIFKYNTDDFKKYNLRFKGNIQVTDWLKLTSNTDLSSYNYNYPLSSINKYDIWTNIKLQGFPMAMMFNPDGTLTRSAANSVGEFYYGKSRSLTKQTYFRNTIGFASTALKNSLNIKGDFSYQYTNTEINKVLVPVPYSEKPGEIRTEGTNFINNNNDRTNYYAGNLYADYSRKFGLHDIKLLVGGNTEVYQFKNLEVQRDGLILDQLPDFNLAAGGNYKIAGGGNEWATMGAFYRLNYGFKNKYLLELNGRYDGSSKFPASQQFGFFPSVSAGWNLAEENFMERTRNVINVFKLRSSYGSLGNGQISPYLYEQSIKAVQSGIILNGVFPTYLRQPAVLPDGFTWEKSTTLDFGVDIQALNNRLTTNFDWYQRKTTDMITEGQPLPDVFGAAIPKGNYADLTTKGFELSVKWSDQIRTGGKPIHYSFRAILSDNYAVIDKFYNPNKLISSNYVGRHVGEIWGYTFDGLFASEEDIQKHADQTFVKVSSGNKLMPGDVKFKDMNGDRVINTGKSTLSDPGDLSIIGNSEIRYPYGFTTNWEWNNISLSAFVQGIGKRNWWPGNESGIFWGQYTRWYGQIPKHTIDGTWTLDNPNPDSYFPRYRGPMTAAGRELGTPIDRYLQNVSYVRLKDITLAYTIPTNLVKRLKVSNMRVYVSGQNIWTYSPMFKLTKDIDPEVIEGSDPEIRNDMGDGASYPMLKTFTFGLNLTF